ncbi:MAG: bifunctional acetate--CoA ligase family protein/GNAT family N-acetyltransferase [Candidatus Promineifilaceae bacterium]
MIDLTRGRSHNVLRYTGNPLDVLFAPRSVAVIGASERPGSVGRTVFDNLFDSAFNGPVFAVNPDTSSVLGELSYPSIVDVPQQIDLAVVATPADTVPLVMRQCGAAGVKSAVILSAGFKEIGPEGAALEAEVLREARQSGVRFVGPNCIGLINPYTGLNASFAARLPLPGNVGFASQSGALFAAILDWSIGENVGFSSFVSTGSMADVDWGDLIYYFGDDPATKSILIYMETIGDARSFMSAAREVALTKPIIVMKPGRTAAGARAAEAHTGADSGDDRALDAAFRRCGVLRVETIAELFSLAEVLAKQPRPLGPRLTIVTNAGGAGVSAADRLIEAGGELAPLSPALLKELDDVLPPHWSHSNPIDLMGDADAQRYKDAISLVAKDRDSDGLLVILTPQAMTEAKKTAEALQSVYDRPAGYPYGKPVLASWMGGESIAAGIEVLNQANIPTFAYADTAARLFTAMWHYQKRLRSLYETPQLPAGQDEASLKRFFAGEFIDELHQAGRTWLTDYESKQILEAYGIPALESRLAHTADEATAQAEEIGFPVVLKAYDEAVQTDGELARVRLAGPEEVRKAFRAMKALATAGDAEVTFAGALVEQVPLLENGHQLQLVAAPDRQLGPVLRFGLGGHVGSLLDDVELGLPPLNSTLARRMMERTAVYQAMRRSGEIDMPALEDLLVRFSQIVVQQGWIKRMEIDPLLVTSGGASVVGARIELYGPEVDAGMLPRLAIRPYPRQYVEQFVNREGTRFVIRPIRPEDEPLLVDFHARLSEQSVYMRYFRAFELSQRVEHERLTRLCFIDYDRTIALVITWHNPETDAPEIVAAGRLTRLPDPQEAEYAILVRDDFQGQGLGTILLKRLLHIGHDEGIDRVIAYMLPTNSGMINISKKLGFRFQREEDLVKAVIDLDALDEWVRAASSKQ